MALWAGTSINTTALSQMFNQLWDMKGIDMVRDQNAFLYGLMGKRWEDTMGVGGVKVGFERRNKISGNKIEVRLLGKLDSISTVADGSSSLAAPTITYASDYWGAAVFDLTHYADTPGIPSDEWKRIKGNEAKTRNFVADRFQQIVLSLENTIGNALHGVTGSGYTRTALGEWRHAVSDGVTSGESSYATYGTIDRSDSANADFRGVVSASVGNLTIPKIRTHLNNIATHYRIPDFGMGDVTTITAVQGLIDPYTQIVKNDDWKDFPGEYVQLGRTKYFIDHRAPANVLPHFNGDTWAWYESEDGLQVDGFQKAVGVAKAGYIMNYEYWCQAICVRPQANGIMTGLTF